MRAAGLNLFCLNCDREVPLLLTGDVCFCSAFCREMAAAVRYAREATSHGRRRPWDPPVARTMEERIAFATDAGFPERRGALEPAVRARVVERDGGRCRRCGRPGTDVARVDGRSREEANLALLCRECHRRHARGQLAAIAGGEAMSDVLAARIGAEPPARVCDDETAWHLRRRELEARRRELRRDMAGRVERASRLGASGEPAREDLIREARRAGLGAMIPVAWGRHR